MIVLDASVLIAYLDARDAHHHMAQSLLEREIDGQLLVNPLTLGEVLVGPVRVDRLDDALTVLRELGIVEQPFPTDAAARLAQLRVRTGLRMPDCCVVLAAQDATARVASFDVALIKAATTLGLSTAS
ncbi:MAG: type II toxin-antitoxin system VapC family toxin [Acidimicrobiia bacterium]|nr:type II toxin-antitoxin system VapC family toxin [Acidimicrobiia bacterium]